MKTIEQRFWPKVDKDGPLHPHNPSLGKCWLWTRPDWSRSGYGRIEISGKWVGVHRISYEIHNGKIPEGLLICHSCDNPPCVNPDHLFAGTKQDNNRDKKEKGRSGCVVGEDHPNAILSNEKILEIKKTPFYWGLCADFGRKFKVDTSTISHIRKGRLWNHIKP